MIRKSERQLVRAGCLKTMSISCSPTHHAGVDNGLEDVDAAKLHARKQTPRHLRVGEAPLGAALVHHVLLRLDTDKRKLYQHGWLQVVISGVHRFPLLPCDLGKENDGVGRK